MYICTCIEIGNHTKRIAFQINKVTLITTAMKQNTTSMPSRNVLIKCIYNNTLSTLLLRPPHHPLPPPERKDLLYYYPALCSVLFDIIILTIGVLHNRNRIYFHIFVRRYSYDLEHAVGCRLCPNTTQPHYGYLCAFEFPRRRIISTWSGLVQI